MIIGIIGQSIVIPDFDSYVKAQEDAAALYQDQSAWTQKSILNTAASGMFSSDRTISQYNNDIWQVKAIEFNKAQGERNA